jgi:hypothetical protein
MVTCTSHILGTYKEDYIYLISLSYLPVSSSTSLLLLLFVFNPYFSILVFPHYLHVSFLILCCVIVAERKAKEGENMLGMLECRYSRNIRFEFRVINSVGVYLLPKHRKFRLLSC